MPFRKPNWEKVICSFLIAVEPRETVKRCIEIVEQVSDMIYRHTMAFSTNQKIVITNLVGGRYLGSEGLDGVVGIDGQSQES